MRLSSLSQYAYPVNQQPRQLSRPALAFSSLRLKVIEMQGLSRLYPHQGSNKEKESFAKQLCRFMAGSPEQAIKVEKFSPQWRNMPGLDPNDFFGSSNRLFFLDDLVFLLSVSADRGKIWGRNRYYDRDRLAVSYYSPEKEPLLGASEEGSTQLLDLSRYYESGVDSLRKGMVTEREKESHKFNIVQRAKRMWKQDGARLLESLPTRLKEFFQSKGLEQQKLYQLISDALANDRLRWGELHRLPAVSGN